MCGFAVRFFDKLLHRHNAAGIGIGADVTVTGLRRRWHDAKSHELAGFGGRYPLFDRGPKGLDVPDDVVGRHQQQDCLRIALSGLQGRQCDRRCRVAPFGLEQERRAHFDRLELLYHRKPMCLVGDDKAVVAGVLQPANPERRGLQHGFFAGQRQ